MKRLKIKRLLALICCFAIAVTFIAGCGSNSSSDSTPTPTTAPTPTPTAAETPEPAADAPDSTETSAPAPTAAETAEPAAPASGEPIYIGTSLPMTGTVAADGLLIIDAIQLALDQANAAGGINGRPIELKKEDDEAKPASAAAIANKFAEDDDILAVISSYNSSCAFAQIPVYLEAGLPAISAVATNPSITGMSPYFYRTVVSDAFSGKTGANLCKSVGWDKIALLYESDDYGYGIYEEFYKEANNIGLEIAYEGTFVYGETKDFSTILTSIQNADVQGIYICGLVTETALIAHQMKTLGITGVGLAGANGLYSPALIDEGGVDVEGLYTLGAFSTESDDPIAQSFVAAYNEKYGEDPSSWGALAYDAAMVIIEAMKSAASLDRESINNAISTIEYQGVTGMNKFVNGDVEKEEIIFVVKDGKFEVYNP